MRGVPGTFRSVLSFLAAAIAFVLLAAPAVPQRAPAQSTTVVTIGGPLNTQPVAPGFVGLSFEYWAIPAYAGNDAAALDPVFVQLIRKRTKTT